MGARELGLRCKYGYGVWLVCKAGDAMHKLALVFFAYFILKLACSVMAFLGTLDVNKNITIRTASNKSPPQVTCCFSTTAK